MVTRAQTTIIIIIIIIIRISRAPIYHTRWQHRVLYNNTNHTHTHMHARTHAHAHTHTHARTRTRTLTHTVSDEGMGRAVKNSLEILNRCVLRAALKEEVESEWQSV